MLKYLLVSFIVSIAISAITPTKNLHRCRINWQYIDTKMQIASYVTSILSRLEFLYILVALYKATKLTSISMIYTLYRTLGCMEIFYPYSLLECNISFQLSVVGNIANGFPYISVIIITTFPY
jgi:hypothetical protein